MNSHFSNCLWRRGFNFYPSFFNKTLTLSLLIRVRELIYTVTMCMNIYAYYVKSKSQTTIKQ